VVAADLKPEALARDAALEGEERRSSRGTRTRVSRRLRLPHGPLLRALKARASVSAVRGEALVLLLDDDAPPFSVSHRAAVSELGRDRPVPIFGRLGRVDDS